MEETQEMSEVETALAELAKKAVETQPDLQKMTEPETELKLHDVETGYELSRVNVGEIFQLKGVHFKVTRIDEVDRPDGGKTSEVVLVPMGYTSARLKKFKREMKKREKQEGTKKKK